MTIEANSEKVGRFGRRGAASGQRELLPIGELDENIFNCPACARPLGVGTSRCPGCDTRLIFSVRATRAVGFMVIGLVLGLAIGGGVVAVVSAVSRPATGAIVDSPPIVIPSAVPVDVPVASIGPPVVDPSIPSSALSALRQSAVINQRLLANADRLALVMSVARPVAKDIAPILRGLASTASFGHGLAPELGRWDDGLAVSEGLAAFYSAIEMVAHDGLAASLVNDAAYARAGRRMLGVFDKLPDLDAASRALAAGVDVELTPLISDAP